MSTIKQFSRVSENTDEYTALKENQWKSPDFLLIANLPCQQCCHPFNLDAFAFSIWWGSGNPFVTPFATGKDPILVVDLNIHRLWKSIFKQETFWSIVFLLKITLKVLLLSDLPSADLICGSAKYRWHLVSWFAWSSSRLIFGVVDEWYLGSVQEILLDDFLGSI